MKIKKICINNWRSIREIEVDFQNLMIIIGQNNHGKSNLLTALLFFFGQGTALSEGDFNTNHTTLFVEVTFKDLDPSDKKVFAKYLLNNQKEICIRKTAFKADLSSAYNAYCQKFAHPWLQEENLSAYATRSALKLTPLNDLLPEKGKITADQLRQAQQFYIETQQALGNNIETQTILEESPFLGKKNFDKSLLGELIYIPANSSVSDELKTKGKSFFGKLYARFIEKLSANNQQYQTLRNQINALVESLNKTDAEGKINLARPKELTELETRLENELGEWDTKVAIQISPPQIDDIFLNNTQISIDDGVITPIERKGHGLQRAMVFALVRSWAALVKEEYERNKHQQDSQKILEKPNAKQYFIFEEPELYLHPQAQKQLYESLKQLSYRGYQVILSTHSSSFIDLKMYKSIAIVYKENIQQGTKVRQCSQELFPKDDHKRNFNLNYWINPDRGELFFAKKTILVEGQTEKTVIPYLAKKLKVFRHDYTIIDCGNKSNILTYLTLLNKFDLPYLVVYDKDIQDGKNNQDKQSAISLSEKIEESILAHLGSTVVFINDIEEEIGIESKKTKALTALSTVSEKDYQIPASLKAKILTIYG